MDGQVQVPVEVPFEDGHPEHGEQHEQDAEEGLVHVEIGAQAAAHARDDLVVHVAVEFALAAGFGGSTGAGSCRSGRGVLFLDDLGAAEDADDALDVGAGHDPVAPALLVQQFRHPLLDAFDDLASALAAGIECFQFAEVSGGKLRGVLLHREGIAAQADFFYFFHAFLRVWMPSTRSRQASSIRASCSRPLSEIT